MGEASSKKKSQLGAKRGAGNHENICATASCDRNPLSDKSDVASMLAEKVT